MQIYIAQSGTQTGPYSEEQVQEMLREGLALPGDLAWHDGVSDWQPLSTLLGSKALHHPTELLDAIVPPAATLPPPEGPTGVGGWLAFFCINLTLLDPLAFLIQMSRVWAKVQPSFKMFPSLRRALIWEGVGSIVLVIYSVIVGCMIWSGSPRGRELARRLLLTRLFGGIAMEVIGLFIMRDLFAKNFAVAIGGGLKAILTMLVGFLIWWLYFKKSKRVKNTYGDENA